MKLISLILFSLINKTVSYEKLENTDFYGGDMYPIYDVNESIKCMSLCEQIRNCKLVSYCDNTCYIKDIKTNQSEKIGCVSYDMYPYLNTTQTDNSKNDNNEDIEEPKATVPIDAGADTDQPTTIEPIVSKETQMPDQTPEVSSIATLPYHAAQFTTLLVSMSYLYLF